MKKIFVLTGLWVCVAAGTVRGQDAGTQQQLDKLTGSIQDLTDAQAQESKRIDDIEKQLADLAAKVNTPPPASDSASAEDLKKLADEVRELDQKRLADRELITSQLEKLSKIAALPPEPHQHKASVASSESDPTAPPVPTTGYYYVVKSGDSIASIARKYRAQHVKITTSQIIRANPGLSASTLFIGKKIFIPDADAK